MSLELVVSLIINAALAILSTIYRKKYREAVARLREVIEILTAVERCLSDRYVPAEAIRELVVKAKKMISIEKR